MLQEIEATNNSDLINTDLWRNSHEFRLQVGQMMRNGLVIVPITRLKSIFTSFLQSSLFNQLNMNEHFELLRTIETEKLLKKRQEELKVLEKEKQLFKKKRRTIIRSVRKRKTTRKTFEQKRRRTFRNGRKNRIFEKKRRRRS